MILTAGCAHVAPLTPRPPSAPEVRMIDVGTVTHAYVVMGARPILVDTGWNEGSVQKIVRALADAGVQPQQLSLIVLTHGHGDHAGGAKRLHALSGAPVAAHTGDVPMLAAGRDRPLKPQSTIGKILRSASDKPFEPVTPDLVLTGELDLRPYGVDGKVVPVPGHTPGSMAVLLPNGEAIVGDLVRGSLLAAHTPERHFFHDDCPAAEAQLAQLVAAGYHHLYVGHRGPVEGERAVARLRRDPCPK